MTKELAIHTGKKTTNIALLEDKKLVELHRETGRDSFQVGDIYIGRVRKVIVGLNAAFVDIGHQKDAFLHYTDLGPYVRTFCKVLKKGVAGNLKDPHLTHLSFEKEIVKTGKIGDVLKNRQLIPVQIVKEAISTKGPKLSCELSIAGRYLVLSPLTKTVGVSKKISSADERNRLKTLVEGFKPEKFGVIVRTAAEGVKAKALQEDILSLLNKWSMFCQNTKGVTFPHRVLSEMDKTMSVIRDLLDDSFSSIHVDSLPMSKSIQAYLKQVAPGKERLINVYNGKTPLLDSLGVTKQIKSSFGKSVSLRSGAYIIIEHTEALHVIDVNSGHRGTMTGNQQENALRVNIDSVKEIARQLRLRDIGGIIIVDFIDVKDPGHKKQIYTTMVQEMSSDKAKHKILPLTKFGLMQITRQRVRPEVNISTTETCPSCKGTGKIEATILLVDEIERYLTYIVHDQKKIHLYVHPFVAAYLTKGFPSIRLKWLYAFRKWIRVVPNINYTMTKYQFFDYLGEQISVD